MSYRTATQTWVNMELSGLSGEFSALIGEQHPADLLPLKSADHVMTVILRANL